MIVLIPYINLLDLYWIIKCLFSRNMEHLNVGCLCFRCFGINELIGNNFKTEYHSSLCKFNISELLFLNKLNKTESTNFILMLPLFTRAICLIICLAGSHSFHSRVSHYPVQILYIRLIRYKPMYTSFLKVFISLIFGFSKLIK